ncbi:MAG: serine/threonine protein kinase with repeat [Acidobacteria bacterium]|nr:serine/threonine protein kinase with repeat [Acidobacteriota bacterium]
MRALARSPQLNGSIIPPAHMIERPDDSAATQAQPASARTTQSIGPYRLMQPIGEGGMGTVWLAEQTRPVRRQVALKIIKAGMDTAQVVARFEAERQALAMMDHPAIARVFDAAATPEGRPYFVMEYIKGEPITTYCTRHKRSVAERIALFLQVCDGVQHAHQKGVIHRDLKPSNVLVTLQDDRPVPKIIDFGVAKATTQTLTDRTLYTELGSLVGTPEYMSPEQAEMSGLDVDTRTDVYALGAILYELLTGVLPFDSKALRANTLEEIRRTIREVDPPRPSTRVTTVAASGAAPQPRHDAGRLASQLKGDLDWITMKALEKDRTRRYGSASDLAADLQRHLNHEPVLASPPSTAYRVSKFVRRHRVSVAGGALVSVLLIAFGATMATQARRIARERDRASREESKAKAVNAFLQDLLSQASSYGQAAVEVAPDPDIKVRTALDRAAAQITGKFDQEPLVEASIRQTLGQTYGDLGLYRQARPHADRAFALRQRLLGDDHVDTLDSLAMLAYLDSVQGDYTSAARRYAAVLDARRRLLGPRHRDTLRAMNQVARIDALDGRTEQAEARYTEALAVEREVLAPDDSATMQAMVNLAGTYLKRGAPKEAEPLLTQALAIRRRTLGAAHPSTVSVMEQLAQVYGQQAQYAQAEPMRREILEVRRHALGAEHPSTIAAMGNLALSLSHQKQRDKLAEAETLLAGSLDAHRRVSGTGHPSTILDALNLAEVLEAEAKYADAERVLRQALDVSRNALGPEHSLTLGLVSDLGWVRIEQHRYADAEPPLREANAGFVKTMPNHINRFDNESILGQSLMGQRKYAEAEPLLLEGYNGLIARIKTIPAYNMDTVTDAGDRIVRLYDAWGKPAQAAEWRKKIQR